jgi:hypothetical protein
MRFGSEEAKSLLFRIGKSRTRPHAEGTINHNQEKLTTSIVRKTSYEWIGKGQNDQ